MVTCWQTCFSARLYRKNTKDLSFKYLTVNELFGSKWNICPATSSSHDPEARVSTSGNGEEDLWSLWGRIVSNWETEWKRRNQFVRDLVRQGVPHHFRGIVWQLLAGVDTSPEKKLYASYIKVSIVTIEYIELNLWFKFYYFEFSVDWFYFWSLSCDCGRSHADRLCPAETWLKIC